MIWCSDSKLVFAIMPNRKERIIWIHYCVMLHLLGVTSQSSRCSIDIFYASKCITTWWITFNDIEIKVKNKILRSRLVRTETNKTLYETFQLSRRIASHRFGITTTWKPTIFSLLLSNFHIKTASAIFNPQNANLSANLFSAFWGTHCEITFWSFFYQSLCNISCTMGQNKRWM